jgi:hypothetical protein
VLIINNCFKRFQVLFASIIFAMLPAVVAMAGGGMVLKDDACIIEIDFYSAHFTAYQPETRGNEQFCQQLPDIGEVLFVLDYLHPSMKEVPVSLRVIHDVTGQNEYVKLKHVEQIEDIESLTVFFQPPIVRPDASFQVDFDLLEEGSYIGIVTVGHPSTDATYTAVFPFEAGGLNINYSLPFALLFLTVGIFLINRWLRSRDKSAKHEVGT